jgi:hypothetical protein
MRSRIPLRSLATAAALVAVAGPVAAHGGGLGNVTAAGAVPLWLTMITGGVVVGVSFLFASIVTDHDLIRDINGWWVALPSSETVARTARAAVRALAVVVLVVVLVAGVVGPADATRNFAVLTVWVGWWAGFTMSVYLVGNAWPAVDPFRTIASFLPDGDRDYPEHLGVWPSVVGLLAVVWLEVTLPVGDDPRLLAAAIAAYAVVTFVGATAYGSETWFGVVDPVSRVFRCYGRLAPVQRTDDGLTVALPSTAAAQRHGPDGFDETPFVVALLWVTSFDGFVTTPAWSTIVEAVVGVGVPALLVYLAVMLGGFALFHRAYVAASRRVPEYADSYVTPAAVRKRFAGALLPIAAGYHLAHYLGYFLALAPALGTVALSPFDPPANVLVLSIPGWFSVVPLAAVVLGHLLAVWVSHGIAFDLFPGRLTPIRSQYPFIAVMILYTMTSLWIVAQPYAEPPYV